MSYNQGLWYQQEQNSAKSTSCESASEFPSSTSIKRRIKWTTDLHEKFVECVNHLGGPMKATPKEILKLMRTHELTIYHIKSHLQNYRSLKHVQDSMQEVIHQDGSRIKELMKMQDEVGQHLQKQLEMQRELFLLVEEQNKELDEMVKNSKGKTNL
ncbi:Myb family transcription factor RLI1 [Cardamine amara subsp. amara]|uniref:Myb family transcription factor RLI1 n=1 Tax=Cardamine amara subsp. amara TaxID=228776 RepID=A0ABD1B258_CARAN